MLSRVAIDGEEHIISALEGFTKASGGKFPDSITDWGEWAVLSSKVGSKEMSKAMRHLGAITPFLFSMSKDDYEYLGKGKSTDDESTIVFWRRDEDGTIRAIFNDFKVAEIDESDLPHEKSN